MDQLTSAEAEKVHQEKVQQEKLKEVKAYLNFEGCSGRSSKIQEVSQHSESRTPNVRGEHRRGRRSRRSRSMSRSPEHTSVFSRIRHDRPESPRHRPVGKGRRDGGVFNRLGAKKRVRPHTQKAATRVPAPEERNPSLENVTMKERVYEGQRYSPKVKTTRGGGNGIVPADSLNSISADYVSAGHVLVPADKPLPTIPTQSPFTYPIPNSSASPSFTQDDTFMPEPIQPMPTFTQPAVHTQTNPTGQQYPNNVQSQQFQQFQTATISANNAKFPYLEKEKYEIWAMKMEYWIQNADHNLWRIVQQGNSPKRLGKDAKGNTIVHPPVSLDEHVAVQRENKVRTLLLQALPEDHMPDFHHYDDARDIWMAVKALTRAATDSHPIRHIGSPRYAVSDGQNRLGELAHTRLTIELADRTMKYPKGIAENVLVRIGKFTFPVDFIILYMPEDIKVPLILGRPFLSIAWSKFDVYKRKITLRVGEEKIIFKSVKHASSLIRRVYMLSLRERMELDLEAKLMGETLVLNRSLDPFLEDYIKLNDLNEPIELRRNQGDDLMPTIEEGEVIEEFRTRDEYLDTGIDDYPSYCDDDKKIRKDCTHNLKFSCMIGFEFTHVNFFLLLYINVMSRKFHNSIMKNNMVYKGDNVVRALVSVPIFVGTFSVMTDFAVLEDMDVIFGESFLQEVGIKTKWFEGIITLYNNDDEVTYQMVRSHSRFKNYTNEQCNKIPPLLKVSEKDEKNEISHGYQKLKGFYKGVLNLGPDYIRDAKMEEWITCGHISVHEME
ncbi:homeodomain-like protein [Tanacetum coccineum]